MRMLGPFVRRQLVDYEWHIDGQDRRAPAGSLQSFGTLTTDATETIRWQDQGNLAQLSGFRSFEVSVVRIHKVEMLMIP